MGWSQRILLFLSGIVLRSIVSKVSLPKYNFKQADSYYIILHVYKPLSSLGVIHCKVRRVSQTMASGPARWTECINIINDHHQ